MACIIVDHNPVNSNSLTRWTTTIVPGRVWTGAERVAGWTDFDRTTLSYQQPSHFRLSPCINLTNCPIDGNHSGQWVRWFFHSTAYPALLQQHVFLTETAFVSFHMMGDFIPMTFFPTINFQWINRSQHLPYRLQLWRRDWQTDVWRVSRAPLRESVDWLMLHIPTGGSRCPTSWRGPPIFPFPSTTSVLPATNPCTSTAFMRPWQSDRPWLSRRQISQPFASTSVRTTTTDCWGNQSMSDPHLQTEPKPRLWRRWAQHQRRPSRGHS